MISTQGSKETEVDTVAFILEHMRRVKADALPGFRLEVDVQHATGSFDLHFLEGFTSHYDGVTNIAALAFFDSGEASVDRAALPSVMLSAHYDTSMNTVSEQVPRQLLEGYPCGRAFRVLISSSSCCG